MDIKRMRITSVSIADGKTATCINVATHTHRVGYDILFCEKF